MDGMAVGMDVLCGGAGAEHDKWWWTGDLRSMGEGDDSSLGVDSGDPDEIESSVDSAVSSIGSIRQSMFKYEASRSSGSSNFTGTILLVL